MDSRGSLVTSSAPLVTSSDPLVTSSDPLATSSDPLATSSDPLVTSSDPLATSSESLAGAQTSLAIPTAPLASPRASQPPPGVPGWDPGRAHPHPAPLGLPDRQRDGLAPVPEAVLRHGLEPEVVLGGDRQARDPRLRFQRLRKGRPGLLVGRVLPGVGRPLPDGLRREVDGAAHRPGLRSEGRLVVLGDGADSSSPRSR